MYLSPVPGSPAGLKESEKGLPMTRKLRDDRTGDLSKETQPPLSNASMDSSSMDFYAHAKHKLGTMCMDDSVMLCSPPQSRPLKRNKLGLTPKSTKAKTPASLASTVKTDDDEEMEVSPKDLFGGIRKPLSTLEPRPANVNPFAAGLMRCESIDPNGIDSNNVVGVYPQQHLLPMAAPPALPERRKKKFSALPPKRPHHGGLPDLSTATTKAFRLDDDDDDDSMASSSPQLRSPPLKRPGILKWGASSTASSGATSSTRSRFQDDFEVVKVIGGGSFGTVHKVKSRLDGVCYAVKSTKAQFKGQAHRDRMLAEVFALAALSADHEGSEGSRHVVRYYQAWIEDERLFIQTELCDSSLERELQRGRFERTPKSLWTFLRQLLLALELIHTKGLVHLDIKPGNIFVNKPHAGHQPLYKLGDFGLVTQADRQSDVVEGDSRYMSKELLDDFDDFTDRRHHRDLTKSDLFSLGATAYELVQAQPLPPNGPLWHALRDGPPPLTTDTNVPPALNDVVLAMMRSEPSERPSAGDLLKHVPELQSQVQQLALTVGHLQNQVNRLNSPHSHKKGLMRSNTWCG